MGLDMYLSAKRFFWTHKPEEQELANEVKRAMNAPAPIQEVICKAAYWRKANQIHNWFVYNVQDGEDDCRPYEVSREKLRDLFDICREIKKDPARAKTLMPPMAGPFFGTYEIDENYWADIENTIEQLAPIFGPEYEGYDFEYQSSW